MTYPNLEIQFSLPEGGMIEETYPELIDKLDCTCPGGALIQASPLPSATINIGDIIADHSKLLSAFTSAYGMITVIIRMIACIIDVLCALMNPFSVIPAISRLFGTCMPEFILIFPQLAIPAIIICLLKIVLAIIDYILNVIIPIIRDIVENIGMIRDAFKNENGDAQSAIAFKIVSLFKELQNILGILSALGALWQMIEALIKLGIALPCGGSGGSCEGCGDDQCPNIIRESEVDGTDGIMMVLYGEELYDFELSFFSPSKQSDFITLKDFFPKGLDYSEIKDEDYLAYTLLVNGITYAVTSVDSSGILSISNIPGEYLLDGYLSNIVSGVPLVDPLEVRFGTNTSIFDTSYVNRYVNIKELRQNPTYSFNNNGTWKIQTVYDSNNVLFKRDSGTWDAYNISSPSPHIKWKVQPSVPLIGGNQSFVFSINHEELIRHGLIGLGCHPAVMIEKEGLSNRFPEAADTTLPELPNLDEVIEGLSSAMSKVAPSDINSQWVLDNYEAMLSNTVDLNWVYDNYGILPTDTDGLLWALDNYGNRANLLLIDITDVLNSFEEDMLDYIKNTYSKTFDKENSVLSASPLTQTVGNYSTITVIPLDKSGGKLAKGLPIGTIDVSVQATIGTLSDVTEVLDEYGAPTGDFTTTLIHYNPDISTVTATVDGYYISYFDGYDLNPQEIEIEFVEATYTYRGRPDEGEGSGEPLGIGNAG